MTDQIIIRAIYEDGVFKPLEPLDMADREIVELHIELAGDAAARLTARRLLESELVGMWKDRADIKDSTAYARRLREQAQNRGG
jgi:predicted DNA-binding antitoxin AbrB/MazE fold protein